MPRIHPTYAEHYFGHAFWSLTPDTAEYILSFHRSHPEYFRHHRYTFALDEYYIPSIIGSSEKWHHQITNSRQHFCDWSKPICPAILTMQYTKELQATDWLTARKFDVTVDADILDWIDEHLLGI